MKAKESADAVIDILSRHKGGSPETIFMVGIGRGAECRILKDAWPDANWFGCEPNPQFVGCPNFPGRIYPTAIGHVNKSAYFYLKNLHPQGSSLFTRNARSDTRISVDVSTLDWILDQNGPFGTDVLLWMDCEGAEYDAIQGGARFLDSVNRINVELSTNPNRSGWPDHSIVHAALLTRGFVRVETHSVHKGKGVYDCVYMRPNLVNWSEVLCPCSSRGCLD